MLIYAIRHVNTIRHVHGGGGRKGIFPSLKIEKKGPVLNPWVESSIQNVVLRVREKSNFQIFCSAAVGPFFLMFSTKHLSKWPYSLKPPLP